MHRRETGLIAYAYLVLIGTAESERLADKSRVATVFAARLPGYGLIPATGMAPDVKVTAADERGRAWLRSFPMHYWSG